MGLAEKRKTEELKAKMQGWEKEISAAAGTTIPCEVAWDTIVNEEVLNYVEDGFHKVFVESTVEAFKDLCRDQMGKEAVKESVKKIVMQNKNGIYYGDRWCNFQDGVITLDHSMSNVDNVSERTKGFVDTVGKAL